MPGQDDEDEITKLEKREIIQTLALIGNGDFLPELQDAFRDGEKAMAEVNKAYEITVKIKVAPNGARKRVITHDVKTKLPKAVAQSTYLFATDNGQLVQKDPDQRELNLKTVQVTKEEFRKAE